MTVLSAQSIRRYVRIDPFEDRKVHTNGLSYGLTSSGYDLRIKDTLVLRPGDFALATTLEHISIPGFLQGILLDKSTWARQGISMFNTKFEPGWRGYPTIEIVNHGRRTVKFEAGCPVAQMEFHWLDERTESPYDGKYQDQKQEATEAIFE